MSITSTIQTGPMKSVINPNDHASIEVTNSNNKKLHPRSKFSPEEDEQLKMLVESFGTNDWQSVARSLPERNARQCRDRWLNYLSPEVINGPWTEEEESLLVMKFEELGPSWKQIATFFPTRTDINIKSRWHLRERRLKKEDLQMKKAILRQQHHQQNIRRNVPQQQMTSQQITSQQITSQQMIPIQQQVQQIQQIQQMQQIQQLLQQQQQQILTQQQPAIMVVPQIQQKSPTQQIQQQKEEAAMGEISSEPLPAMISTEPLPFFSSQIQTYDNVANEINEMSFNNIDDTFDTNATDCFNSLMMNEENLGFENCFDTWF